MLETIGILALGTITWYIGSAIVFIVSSRMAKCDDWISPILFTGVWSAFCFVAAIIFLIWWI